MPVDAAASAEAIERDLRRVGTAERAEGSRRYLKSDLEFTGTTLPDVDRIVRSVLTENELSRKDLLDLVTELWSAPVFERRIAGVKLLSRRVALLREADLAFVEALLRRSETWALVDPLAVDVTGRLIQAHPGSAERLDRWAADPNFWIRRSALLGLMRSLKEGAEIGRFTAYAEAMLEEKEFFIRKAIGWVLREASKTDPAAVYNFLQPRVKRTSGVTFREAVKYLPEDQQSELKALFGARRNPAP